MKSYSVYIIMLLALVTASCNTIQQPLSVVKLFSDNMVLQQQMPIPVWGKATPNSTIKVQFRQQEKTTKTDKTGKWKIVLDTENSGLNDTLIISTKSESITFYNVAVGEVWIASGQSNMEVNLVNTWGPINNGEEEAKNANYPNIRLIKIERNTTVVPVDTIKTSGWQPCTPESVKDFSAVGYFFARKMYNNLDVPIGIIQSTWGGTIAEAWTSSEMLSQLGNYTSELNTIKNLPIDYNEQMIFFNEVDSIQHTEIAVADAGIDKTDSIFTHTDFDDTDWLNTNLPMKWAESELGNFTGSVWFRNTINLPGNIEKSAFTLHTGSPDDYVEAWVNGIKIGSSPRWAQPQKYTIPKNVLKTGKNVITLRVLDLEGGGGFQDFSKDFSIENNSGFKIDLCENWKMHKGFDFDDIKTKPIHPDEPNRATTLFNGMIHPLIPYAFKGVIWYQGENNTDKPQEYSALFQGLITDWRTKWNAGNFPFYFVQLANYGKANAEPISDGWAALREAQTSTLNLPNTEMAVTIDIGDPKNIHYSNKQDVGKRLALLALSNTYNKEIQCNSPIFKDYKIEGDKIIVDFDYTYDGLKTSDGKTVKGFAIAGNDEKFNWANAKIKNNKVIVWSNNIKNPVAIRYAWSANPKCNLTNSENLPVTPFRTDSFKLQ